MNHCFGLMLLPLQVIVYQSDARFINFLAQKSLYLISSVWLTHMDATIICNVLEEIIQNLFPRDMSHMT